jgi:hypothetical protein
MHDDHHEPHERTEPTEHAVHLLALARRVVEPFVASAGALAALVAGSVAEGVSDEWSDVDLVLFYDVLPSPDVVDAAHAMLEATEVVPLGGSRDDGVFLEQFRVDGVACQLVHQTVDAWEAQTRTVLEDLDVASPTQKALSGLHAGLPLHGDAFVDGLRARSTYNDALRRAMVERHLQFFPLWRLQASLASRDALLWQHAELVTALQHVLAVLAGVNRVFFSTFQLKKVRALAARLTLAPPHLVSRIDGALTAAPDVAAYELERLVADTLDVVAGAMPDVDTAPVRRQLGRRDEPWRLP